MAIEVLTATLAGGPFGPHIGSSHKHPREPRGSGISSAPSGSIASVRGRSFKADMDAMIHEVKAEPLAKASQRSCRGGDPSI